MRELLKIHSERRDQRFVIIQDLVHMPDDGVSYRGAHSDFCHEQGIAVRTAFHFIGTKVGANQIFPQTLLGIRTLRIHVPRVSAYAYARWLEGGGDEYHVAEHKLRCLLAQGYWSASTYGCRPRYRRDWRSIRRYRNSRHCERASLATSIWSVSRGPPSRRPRKALRIKEALRALIDS